MFANAAELPACPVPRAKTAYLLTMTPGRSLPTSFGHTALLVYDPAKGGESAVYDHGHYDSRDPWFPIDYVRGTAQYWGLSRPFSRVKQLYAHWRRDIHAQRLVLSAAEVDALVAHQEANIGRENSFAYHWFHDNCTTRIRGALDAVLPEDLQGIMSAPTDTSVRRMLLQHVGDAPLAHAFFHGAGARASQPLSSWDAGFLPAGLMRELEGVRRRDGRPLVDLRCVMVGAGGALPGESVPSSTGGYAMLGALVGGLVGLGGLVPRVGRWLVALFGLSVAAVGCLDVLVLLTRAGAPWWTHHHQLIASPLALALVGAAFGSRRALIVSRGLVGIALAASLWWALRGFPHDDVGTVALFLPGLLLSLVVLERQFATTRTLSQPEETR